MKHVRIGGGAGFSGDRIEPAIELVERGGIDYLIFECLAERTIALAQQARLTDPGKGYDPLLDERLRAVLPGCVSRGIRIVTNMGAANPVAAAAEICDIARSLGLRKLRIAAVTGDDVHSWVTSGEAPEFDDSFAAADIVSANAYLGAEPIAQALAGGADVVITGRGSDPALTLGPLIHAFGWAADGWDLLARGTLAGHLLECAGQITGGYFADPGFKDVANLARLGFPIGEISEDGAVIITKVPGSGGLVNAATCKEQLLYEIHDPSAYLTPDVVADFSQVRVTELGPDRVAVHGATGRRRPELLKVSVGYRDGFCGEGQISYAGPGARARANLAASIVAERLELCGVQVGQCRYDLIGVDSAFGIRTGGDGFEPPEVRLRVAGRTAGLRDAIRIGNEVETLYTCGPAGGGGVTKSARAVIAVASTLIPREKVRPAITLMEA
jgi:acyclic terpene utilization AtuA family protein